MVEERKNNPKLKKKTKKRSANLAKVLKVDISSLEQLKESI